MWNIQLFKLNFNHLEKRAVNEVIDSEWLTMGDRTIKFESEFQDYLSNNVMCSAVSSCTAALHLALLALDIRDGDEVIVPGLTFVASANVVKLVGARPVLADCESMDNWNMSVNTIKKCISSRTKAVIIVHFAGYPCSDIKSIKAFCAKKNIPLIEDTAHAPGASVDGIKCGSWGDIGTFSFFSNKNLSIGEGGMISTTNAEMHNRMRSLRSHGMSSLTLDRHKGRASTYDINESGLNYRMDEIRAAIGSVQLGKLEEGNIKRARLTDAYRENFINTVIKIPFSKKDDNNISAYHILPILLPKEVERKKVMEFLKEKKIQSSIHYPAFWDFEAFKNDCKREEAPNVADICDRELTLPLYPTMTEDEVYQVSECLLDAIK